MVDIDKWIETIEKDIAGVNNIGSLKIDKTITIGMGVGHMYGAYAVSVKMETDILRKGHHG